MPEHTHVRSPRVAYRSTVAARAGVDGSRLLLPSFKSARLTQPPECGHDRTLTPIPPLRVTRHEDPGLDPAYSPGF